MKVDCDAIIFTIDVGWIVRDLIVIFFGLKNLNIQFVKRSENKTAICLARFLFQSGCNWQFEGLSRLSFSY